ncbi:metal transporter [Kocuria sediminis]|uniref:Metal transporter n=1 Tax=Kocuria sediminis TaxID=1038857 RepID=A0A6N8GPZ8_9MICC|nr:heavy-metal-associated domain-containing protein [Kocuria sediminis]MUN64859.1 metal transporter [Kocuria sediminis]
MTNPTRSPLPMASAGCACCAPAPATDHTTPAEGTTPSRSTATYQVEGMTCGHCASSVTEELTTVDGVSEVHIDLVAGGISTVTVTADRALSVEAVRAAVEDAGYTLVNA